MATFEPLMRQRSMLLADDVTHSSERPRRLSVMGLSPKEIGQPS